MCVLRGLLTRFEFDFFNNFFNNFKVAFYDLEGQFSLPIYVVDDPELVDGVDGDDDRDDVLVDGRVDVLVDVDDDDRGVAIPGQVDGVCRCPL